MFLLEKDDLIIVIDYYIDFFFFVVVYYSLKKKYVRCIIMIFVNVDVGKKIFVRERLDKCMIIIKML